MPFLCIIIILNAVLDNREFVNQYRLEIGGLPINVFDGLIIFGTLIALLRPRSSAGFEPTDRTHPALWWIIGLFAVALIGGLIAATGNGALARNVITTMRNFLAAPAAVYLAYFLTPNV